MKFNNFFNNNVSNFLEEKKKIVKLFPIQELSIPIILKKQNCIVVSSTGSGKTLCFVLPILTQLKNIDIPQVLILLPTNELSKQVYKVFKDYEPISNSKLSIYNAFKKHKNINNIKSKIILASPFEIIRLIKNGQINLSMLEMIIVDEADMLYEFFKNEIQSLFFYFKKNKNVQFCLFSATLHESLANTIKKNIDNCKIISYKKDIWNNDNISHHLVNFNNVINWNSDIKLNSLKTLLNYINPFFAIVFVNSKKDADIVYKYLLTNGFKVGVIYSELDHKRRRDVLLKASKFEFNVLVATDLAARGIDLEGVSDIISYDLPQDDLYYIHRAGRTGRGKYMGNSYIFNVSKDVEKIRRLKSKINFKKLKL